MLSSRQVVIGKGVSIFCIAAGLSWFVWQPVGSLPIVLSATSMLLGVIGLLVLRKAQSFQHM